MSPLSLLGSLSLSSLLKGECPVFIVDLADFDLNKLNELNELVLKWCV